MDGSFNEFLQMAQVSAHISQDHIVTAFHFLISNLGPVLLAEELDDFPPADAFDDDSSFPSRSIDLFSSAIFTRINKNKRDIL